MNRGRNILLALVVGAFAVVLGSPVAGAQTDDPVPASVAAEQVDASGSSDVAFDAADPTSDDAATDDETETRVRSIVIALVAIGVVATVLTGLFWYHTIPSRRVIAARKRRAVERPRPVPVPGPSASSPVPARMPPAAARQRPTAVRNGRS